MAKFVKGQSGNPGGRPKNSELRELCQAKTKEAVNTLMRIMQNKKAPAASRVAAACALLDRGYGKPIQAIQHSGDMTHFHATELTDGELANIAGRSSNRTAEEKTGKTQVH